MLMFVLDFDADSKQAFTHGFVKGLAAPVCLFHSEPAPKPRIIPPLVRVGHASVREAMRADWQKVGNHIRGAMNEHQKSPSRS